MSRKTYYITTPIYYPSAKLHIGHTYCTVAADTMARFKRMQGYDVMFLTGTDEHGQKIEEKAKEKGVTPKQYVDDMVVGIHDLWKLMNISNDRFVRTTDDYHIESVQKIFKDLFDKGEIYKGSYKGKYCTPCEAFWTETQITNGKCPDCDETVKDAEEEAYFFRLSNYSERLMDFYYKENPDFLKPESRLNEMVNNFIKPGLKDLCVSRTSISWGVPVDFDKGHIVYVWIDALSNYITALGYKNNTYDDYGKYWPADAQFVGKEITRFHTIVWPALLMALDLPTPKKVFGHGWILLDGKKMSKSKGNVVDPVILCERYGVDALRYFLMREFPFSSDSMFSNELLINRINSDLANDLGNLVSRTLTMCQKYFGNHVPNLRRSDSPDDQLLAVLEGVRDNYEREMEQFSFHNALAEVMKIVSRANKYIDETKPWVLGAEGEEHDRLAAVIHNLLETIRIAAILLSPFMPDSCDKIIEMLGISEDESKYEKALYFSDTRYHIVRGDNLFPRIDLAKELALLNAQSEKKEKPKKEEKKKDIVPVPEGMIDFAHFQKMKIICAQIIACEPVPKADKLLKITLDDGSGTNRQIVSGIHECYKPDELIGKKIALIANLMPAKFRGVESNGMLLAADIPTEQLSDACKVLFLDESIPCGARIG